MKRNALILAVILLVANGAARTLEAAVAGNRYLALDTFSPHIGIVNFCPAGSVSSTVTTFAPTSYSETNLGLFSILNVSGGGVSTGIGASVLFGSLFFFVDSEGSNVTGIFGFRTGVASCP